ncbi:MULTISPECIES: hypothetical protein [Bradyrhizobium]|uniref:hypothetical protein n=1 Tax=Bradyrhizobium TaxID=374 RepID=UPI001BAB82D0|nr:MULTISPECIES: hypothetical protein [Bradyrhizobium]MBR0879656.1 hypothetical protein [Bradyrhizobium liaoningense]MCP1778789.1 hypothetical protein [Bradyrhizobium japonicum]MCP1958213.1 hypothetical protein [Bradyrhizobium japonicum]
MSYDARDEITHLDGTKIFQNEADRDSEADVAAIIEKHWKCRIVRFGMLAPIDWFAERHGRVVGLLELKSRRHASNQYATPFLNVRKWLAMSLGSVGLGCPALFVVRFTDEVRWVTLSKIDACNQRIGGCAQIVKSQSDIEPVIEIAVADMQVLRGALEEIA